jgi:DNA-binding transcriptional regulator YiaG
MNMLDAKGIRTIRESLGLTQTQFAAALGVTENAVRRWEYGDRHPRWETMEKINTMVPKPTPDDVNDANYCDTSS